MKGFGKVMLQPGETKHLSVELDARAFAFYDVAAKGWKIAPGKFNILVGESSATLPLKGDLSISTATASRAEFR